MDWYGKKEFSAVLPQVVTINDAAVGQVKSFDNFHWA